MTATKTNLTTESICDVLAVASQYEQLTPMEFLTLKKQTLESIREWPEHQRFVAEQFLNAVSTARYNFSVFGV